MANKKGRSEKKKDWLGRSYIQHIDSKGNKSGRSERKETFFGKKYTQHTNAKGEKTGRSEKKQTWLGRDYTQKYSAKGEKSGRSEKKETWLGGKYVQHYDTKGNKTDWTERKQTWLGKDYVQRYGEEPKNASTSQNRSSSSSGSSGSSYYGGSGSDYSFDSSTSYTSTPSPSSSESSADVGRVFKRTGQALLSTILLYPVIGLGGCVTRLVIQGSPPHPYDPAHEQWLNAPMRSWSTEAIYIPLLIVGITFLVSVAQLNPRSVALKALTLIVGLLGVSYVGKTLIDTLNYRIPQASARRGVRTARVVSDKDLNLRSAAGKRSSRVIIIPRNTPVTVFDESVYVENELWVKIRVGSYEGWVHSEFLIW